MKRLLVLFASAALLLTGCDPKNSDITFAADPASINYTYQGGEKTFTLDAPSAWTASVPTWITLSATSGEAGKGQQITVNVDSNIAITPLTGDITIVCGDETKTVGVNVEPYPHNLSTTYNVSFYDRFQLYFEDTARWNAANGVYTDEDIVKSIGNNKYTIFGFLENPSPFQIEFDQQNLQVLYKETQLEDVTLSDGTYHLWQVPQAYHEDSELVFNMEECSLTFDPTTLGIYGDEHINVVLEGVTYENCTWVLGSMISKTTLGVADYFDHFEAPVFVPKGTTAVSRKNSVKQTRTFKATGIAATNKSMKAKRNR